MSVPTFVADLRRQVGPDFPLWLSGVNAVVLGAGSVLLHQRSDDGRWSLPGGILDPGEQPAAGVVREVFEETGVHVEVRRLVAVTVSPPRVHPNGDHAQYLELTFVCDAARGKAHVHDSESVQVAWFLLNGLPDMEERSLDKVRLAVDGGEAAWFQPALEATEFAGSRLPGGAGLA
jgi:ADP-ribose pyrophosphatase YjhB (NUDIX family)